jgi:Zn-dependent protease
MGWAWRIATIAGIPIKVHGTFAVLIIFLLVSGLVAGRGLAAAASSVLFILAIFTTIILHELGHALMAKRFGVKTRDITLLPIGGLARLERMPDLPRQELWVALAGPAVNVVIGVVCYALFRVATGAAPTMTLDPSATGFIERFTAVNFTLAAFNMVPAFPMDGGRALRAVLAERLDYARATDIAASIGQGLALVFGLIGLFVDPILIFIALFVWMGASGEATATSMRTALAGVPVSRAMITDFKTVRVGSPLREAVELVLTGSQTDFPVLSDGTDEIVGILTRDKLMAALSSDGPGGVVGDASIARFEEADPREMLDGAVHRLQRGSSPMVLVLQDGRLVGLLTAENVAEFVMVRTALTQGPGSASVGR